MADERTTRERVRSQRERDLALLDNLTDREARIADAATRLAYDKVGDWLSTKQTKAEQYPGGNLTHATGRANAYRDAAVEIHSWAVDEQTADLKPCPFCGGLVVNEIEEDDHADWVHLECGGCGARTKSVHWSDHERPIDLWNRRAA